MSKQRITLSSVGFEFHENGRGAIIMAPNGDSNSESAFSIQLPQTRVLSSSLVELAREERLGIQVDLIGVEGAPVLYKAEIKIVALNLTDDDADFIDGVLLALKAFIRIHNPVGGVILEMNHERTNAFDRVVDVLKIDVESADGIDANTATNTINEVIGNIVGSLTPSAE